MAITINGSGTVTGITAGGLPDNSITTDDLASDLTLSGDTTVASVTETITTKSASFTPNLSTESTIFNCSGTMTITMPSAEAGKSFTVIHSSGSSITWSGTILWNGGAAPTAAAAKEIYVFLSDGTNWYGNQAGTGYA